MSIRRTVQLLCVGILMAARVSVAADGVAPPPGSVSSSGSCPDAAAVWSAVVAMVPLSDLSRVASGTVDILDLGDSYRVAIRAGDNESIHLYRDTEHNCERRARYAAVFMVLTLAPPTLPAAPGPSPPPAPPPPAPVPAPTTSPAPESTAPPRPIRWRFEVSALLDLAPAFRAAPEMVAPGGELRGLFGSGGLAAMAAIGFEPKAPFTLAGLSGEEMRFPCDLGARWTAATWGRVAAAGEVGLAGAWFRAASTNAAVPRAQWRLDLGGRGGLSLRIGGAAARTAVVVGLHALVFPRQYDFLMTPQGKLGRTPTLWMGATAGVAFAP